LKQATIIEGGTELRVPVASLLQVPPTTPAFFNPAASVNRDISVSITEVTDGETFCDAMAGVGARGVRVANEVTRKLRVTLVDFNKESLLLARRNARINGVDNRLRFKRSETNSFLYSVSGDDRFHYVDLDPFGTPVPFVQPLLNAVANGGIASVTATDTAVLCGVHPRVARRRYGATPMNNEFGHETGIRILINACRREAWKMDLGISSVAAHSTRHYIRVFFRISAGASKADRASANEGYVSVCPRCHDRRFAPSPPFVCDSCGGKTSCAGPLWTGPLSEKRTVLAAAADSVQRDFQEARRILSDLIEADRFPPWGYSIERICSSLKVPTVSESGVAESLLNAGFESTRQPFENRGIKTDARYSEVVRAIRDAHSARRSSG